jgi:polyisoprenoid-binding protein YceI
MPLNRLSSERGMSSSLLKWVMAAAMIAVAVPSLSAQAPGGPPAGPGGPGGQRPPQPPPPPPTAGAHLTIAPEGSSASYSVTEQFVGISFPNDAEGTTPALSGTLVIAADGSIPAGSSKLTADLSKLKSDQDQRDGYIRQRLLETDKFPLAEFVPTKIEGVPHMIPFQGQTGVQITGNLTVHGVTKEVTFQGIATFGRDGTIAGRAKTSFTFETFGLAKPTIARLMSVDDKIGLELVFRFKRS